MAAAIGGGALLTGITGGWFLVLGLISTGLGILNSIKFYLNGSYRRDQQKRAVNRALDEARARLASDVISALDAAQAALKDDADKLLVRLRAIKEEHLEAWRRAHVAAAGLDALAEDRSRLLARAERVGLDKALVLGDVPSTR